MKINSFFKSIEIPADLRGQAIEGMAMSVRLAGVLRRSNIRVLGDLHGCKLDDFALQRNCGYKTLHELDALVRQAHSSVEQAPPRPEAGSLLPGNGVSFVVPESIANNHPFDKFCSIDRTSDTRGSEWPESIRIASMQELWLAYCCGDWAAHRACKLWGI